MNDKVDVPPDSRPACRHQHEHAEPAARQVLLVTKVLVRGDEGVETFGLGVGEGCVAKIILRRKRSSRCFSYAAI